MIRYGQALGTQLPWLIPSILLLINLAVLSRRNPPASIESIAEPNPAPSIPRGTIHTLLHAQNLSHAALHSTLRMHLAALFHPRTVAIVGVATGVDVRAFAAAAYRVHAVEPGTDYVRALRAELSEHPQWNVVVHPYAAAKKSGGVQTIGYLKKTIAKGVPMRRLDDLLVEVDKDNRLALLSVDVQGFEPAVLGGATRLLPQSVDSLLVEASACDSGLPEVLRLLDKDYALFDFVPRGIPLGTPREASGMLKQVFKHMWEPGRPSSFDAFERWMCRRNRAEFVWTQTDFLAVRRDLLPGVWDRLSSIGRTYCGRNGISCSITASKK